MIRHSKGLRKTASLLLSALLSLSVFSVAAPLSLQASAVTYSEMSALDQYAYSGDDRPTSLEVCDGDGNDFA